MNALAELVRTPPRPHIRRDELRGAMSPPGGRPVEDRSERLILAVATHCDRDAYAALFLHFAPRLKAYLARSGSAPETAEELAQETMLTVWHKAPLFDPARAGAATWIFAIARNLRIDLARRSRLPLPEPDPSDEVAASPPADVIVAGVQRARRLRQALAALPPEQAEVVRLSFFDDRPHADIERALGIPLGTVKSRLRLAIARLRTSMVSDE